MSDLSPVLALPYILAAQAQKHVTHNEALRILDVLVQTVVLNRDLTVPPATPAEGDRHIVAPGATGVWAGQDDRIAVFVTDHWEFQTPHQGWTAHVMAENSQATHTGSGWAVSAELPLRVAQLGVSSTPDATNRLSVSSPATLLNHAGTGHQLKINKAAPGDTASLLYQTGFSGRAEMGTAGSDDFAIKVSADGASFNTGLTIAAATAKVSLPAGALVADGTAAAPGIAFAGDSDTGLYRTGANQIGFAAGGVQRADLSTTALTVNVPLAGTAVTQTTTDTTAGRLMKTGDGGWLTVAPATVTLNSAIVTGTYAYAGSGVDANAPTTASGAVLVMRNATTYIVQQAHVANDWARYTRTSADNGATWSAWRKDFNRSNVVGTVSQSAGVVTGAIVETATNANGTYTRFADGTQICWHTLSVATDIATAYFGGFRATTVLTWTFPAVFIAAPNTQATTTGATDAFGVDATAAGTTSGNFLFTAVTSQVSATRNARVMAIGRWF